MRRDPGRPRHLEVPPPDVPPDGYLPAVAYPDPPYGWRPPETRRNVPVSTLPRTPYVPPEFERFDLPLATAARLIGVTPYLLKGWCENVDDEGRPAPLFPHLRRPDGKFRFRRSDCYKAAGIPIDRVSGAASPPPPSSPQEGATAPGIGGPGVA